MVERDWVLMAVLVAAALAAPAAIAVVGLALGLGPAGATSAPLAGPAVTYQPVRLAAGLGLAGLFLAIAFRLVVRTRWSLGDGEPGGQG